MHNVIKLIICNTLTILPLNMHETLCSYAQGCQKHKLIIIFFVDQFFQVNWYCQTAMWTATQQHL